MGNLIIHGNSLPKIKDLLSMSTALPLKGSNKEDDLSLEDRNVTSHIDTNFFTILLTEQLLNVFFA